MSLKSEIIKAFEENRNQYLSGQFLADQFGVSRNAVWKTINALKKDGYEILSVSNKGYLLTNNNDLVSEEGIRRYLSEENQGISIFTYKEIDSTNNEAKRFVSSGVEGTALIIADAQTAGRGRYGKSFYSPEQTGIYMTLVIQPKVTIYDAVTITTASAVAVVRSIQQLTNKSPKIKWVNDIFLDNKKICGILTEAVSDFETGIAQSIIIGIGINVSNDCFPKDIEEIAGSLQAVGVTRNQIIAKIVDELTEIAKNLKDKSFMNEYREHSFVLGKNITYTKSGITYQALASDIDDSGGLVVIKDNGESEVLNSGEISVKLFDGNVH